MQRIKIKNNNILVLSDTHGKHRLIEVPENIQIIIHCGDICTAGDMDEIADFFDWYAQVEIPHKIFVHGNHDLPFDLVPDWGERLIPESVIWLNNQMTICNDISIMGISSYPFYTDIDPINQVDLVASHYPPSGILDHSFGHNDIREFIFQVAPKYHVFGHNHRGYGTTTYNNIQFINASIYSILEQKGLNN